MDDVDLEDWRPKAACREMPPTLFFPDGDRYDYATLERAKEVCRGCEVRSECLEWAVSHNQEHGVWGGMSETERKRYRRTWLARRRGIAVQGRAV